MAEIWWTEQEDREIIHGSLKGLPAAEIARRLGRSHTGIIERRLRLMREGRFVPRYKAGQLAWTTDEKMRLEEMIECGYSVESCAKELVRSILSIKVKSRLLGLRLRRDRRSLTSMEVARIMGLGCNKIVSRWAQRGWLTPLAQECPGHRWRFDELALWDFVTIHEAHMAWNVERITDPDLREHARVVRATAPRWLTSSEVGRRYNVRHQTVNQWIREGVLNASKYGNWWICEDTLVTFIPPFDRWRERVT